MVIDYSLCWYGTIPSTLHSLFTMINPRSTSAAFAPPPPCHRRTSSLLEQHAFVDARSIVASSSAAVTSIEFEPIVDIRALSAFVVISIVFGLLQQRINSVSQAAKRRSAALESLRKAEALQLSTADDDRPTGEDVARAKADYERALTNELNLRTIIPGVRIVAPNDPKRDKEERAAAKRFLGWNDEIFKTQGIYEDDNDISIQTKNSIDSQQNEVERLSTGANILLLLVASTLIILLWTLSLDPRIANQALTAVDQALS